MPGAAGHLVPSLLNLLAGYVLATVVGVVAGVILGLVGPLREAVGPIVEFLRSIPGVALLPLGLLLLGIGTEMKVALIMYGAVWPILLNTIDGVRGIDPTVREVARSYRLPLRLRLTRIILPAASPQIVTGMRTSLSIAITVIVFSEMVGATEGIGYAILQAQRSFSIPEMWAGMLLLGVLGYLLNITSAASSIGSCGGTMPPPRCKGADMPESTTSTSTTSTSTSTATAARAASPDGPADVLLAVRGLSKSYPVPGGVRQVVADLGFEVRRGEIATVVGPSGAGKTTLLRCMAGLLPPSGGTSATRWSS